MDESGSEVQRKVKRLNKVSLPGLFVMLVILSQFLVSCGTALPADFTKNEKLWRSQNITSYNFTLARQCFCPEDVRGPVNLQIRDGKVTAGTYTASGQPINAELFGETDTIDDLFKFIRDAYERKAETVTVTYDDKTGYPKSIYVDYLKTAADEEQGYEVTKFEVVNK